MNNKIAFITPIYEPSNMPGSSVFVKDIAEMLAKQGNDVTVITSNALTARYWYDPIFGKKVSKSRENINGVRVIRLRSNWIISSFLYILEKKLNTLVPKKYRNILNIKYNGPHLMGLSNELEKGKYDTIHVSPLPLNICLQTVTAITKLAYSPKTIITPFYHSELDEFKNPKIKEILKNFNKIHLLSDSEKKTIKERFGILESKFVKIPLFLKREDFAKRKLVNKESNALKSKFKLSDKFIVLFAGNKSRLKGATTLLEAVRQIYIKDKSIRLITIGNTSPEWESAKKPNDKNFLIDLPYKRGVEKEAIFKLCDVFAMPSISESFGLVYLEAWHKNKPVIAARLASTKELIHSNEGGILVKYNSANESKDAILYLKKHTNIRLMLGKNGNRSLLKKYMLKKNLQKYINLFK